MNSLCDPLGGKKSYKWDWQGCRHNWVSPPAFGAGGIGRTWEGRLLHPLAWPMPPRVLGRVHRTAARALTLTGDFWSPFWNHLWAQVIKLKYHHHHYRLRFIQHSLGGPRCPYHTQACAHDHDLICLPISVQGWRRPHDRPSVPAPSLGQWAKPQKTI